MLFSIAVKFFKRVKVSGGVISLSGKTVQAIWFTDVLGRDFNPPEIETWINPSVREARRNFVSMSRRFAT